MTAPGISPSSELAARIILRDWIQQHVSSLEAATIDELVAAVHHGLQTAYTFGRRDGQQAAIKALVKFIEQNSP